MYLAKIKLKIDWKWARFSFEVLPEVSWLAVQESNPDCRVSLGVPNWSRLLILCYFSSSCMPLIFELFEWLLAKEFAFLVMSCLPISPQHYDHEMHACKMHYNMYDMTLKISFCNTCSWRAAITQTKWNKVGSTLFCNSLPIWIQNEHKKDFIIGLQNYQLACTANAALMGHFGRAF